MFQRAILLLYDGNLRPLHHSTIHKNHDTPTSSICIFDHCTTPPYLGNTTHLLLTYLYLSFVDCSNAPPLFQDGNLPPVHHSTILKNHNPPTSSICIFYTMSSFAPLPSYILSSLATISLHTRSPLCKVSWYMLLFVAQYRRTRYLP